MGLDRSLDQEGIPDLEGPLPGKAATGDPQEGVSPPSERAAAEDYGVTAEEGARPEPLDRRIARELPEFDESDLDVGDVYGDPESVGMILVDPADEDVDVGFDEEKDEVARAVDLGLGDVSAEEAAMHVTADPPYDLDDSYLSDDEEEGEGGTR
jgi:hypothetical protein